MKWFMNRKISVKLIIGFVIVAIIAGIVGVIGIYNIVTISNNDTVLYNNMTVPLSDTAEMAKLFQRVRVNTRDMILEHEADEINGMYQNIEDIVVEINAAEERFAATIQPDDTQEAEAYDAFLDARVEFRSYLGDLLELCLANRDEEAYALLKGDMRIAADNEKEAIDQLVALKIEGAKRQSDSNTDISDRANILMISIILAGMGIAVILGILISRIIGNPVKRLSKAAEQIADGDLNINLKMETKDEVGDLAEAFRRMAGNLNEVMTKISMASEQVAAGSRQVSDSSMSLSQGATEQASSVEELSSSLEEIASQTKQNAENADEANRLAEKARDNAAKGNEQMKEMLKAMDEINDSSNSISKIIKVIDDIAFQTNILALNAAVEAARAGQHGKGFAVVAEEVRNLAARSAKAAKETTDMIEGSIRKVDGGTKIANQTADALTQIVGNVTKVATLVGDIAMASNEQASGISQVNQGILQVSDVVQMNSATSEESAAASEELSTQADMLKDQVMKFKLKKRSYTDYPDRKMELQSEPLPQNYSDGDKVLAKGNEKTKKIILNDNEYGKY